ncbi:MAG TPA: hypothetical protein VE422_44220 [Terriglobia bacterium]|jgi:hypothetical protein|nr:hypothetical protein [Terriglobia bacterium]
MTGNPFVGVWTYRSLLNDNDVNTDFGKLEFGRGTLALTAPSEDTLGGTIGGPGWSLDLHGSIGLGSPAQIRFQGRGLVGGEQWVYDYIGWLVPVWPNSNSTLQRPAIVGSVVRTVPHSGSEPGTVNPAGVVASFYAVRAG